MVEFIEDYEVILKKRLSGRHPESELKEWVKDLNIKINYVQEEREIHLIVTLNFGIFFLLTVMAYMVFQFFVLLIISFIFLILLVPYIFHYYYLENTVQRWYLFSDKLEKKL